MVGVNPMNQKKHPSATDNRSVFESVISLRPKHDTEPLDVDEVVDRLTAEFGFVQCDNDRGVRYAAQDLAHHSELTHEAKERSMLPLMNAIEVIIGDDRRHDQHFLKCVVLPNGPIHVLYLYESHASQTDHLLERLATVLGYELP